MLYFFLFVLCIVIVALMEMTEKVGRPRTGAETLPEPADEPDTEPLPSNCRIILDTETTSLEVDKGEVIQLSALKIDERGYVVEAFNTYIRPSENARIDSSAMKVNRIPLSFLKNAPERKEVFEKFLEFCSGVPVVAGYNLEFDLNMLEDDILKEGLEFPFRSKKIKKVDVLKLARRRISSWDIENYRLSTVSSFYGIHTGDAENQHNSLFDCILTYEVWISLTGEYEKSIRPAQYQWLLDAVESSSPEQISLDDAPRTDFFKDKGVAVSGTFDNFTRQDLEKYVVECGGTIKSGISSKVNIFINGYNPSETSKERKYKEYLDKGCDIRKLNEEEFLSLIKDS